MIVDVCLHGGPADGGRSSLELDRIGQGLFARVAPVREWAPERAAPALVDGPDPVDLEPRHYHPVALEGAPGPARCPEHHYATYRLEAAQ